MWGYRIDSVSRDAFHAPVGVRHWPGADEAASKTVKTGNTAVRLPIGKSDRTTQKHVLVPRTVQAQHSCA